MANARATTGLALAASLLVVPTWGRAQVATAPIVVSDPGVMVDAPIVLGETTLMPGPVPGGGLWPDGGLSGPISLPAAAGADSDIRARPPGDLLWQTLHDRGWQALRGFVPNQEERGDRLDAADRLFRAALERLQPYRAGDGRVATTYTDLAWVFFLRERYDEARSLANWALEDRLARLGPYNAETGDSLILLARIAAAQDRYPEAEGYAQRALSAFTRSTPGRHLDLHTPIALDALGAIQVAQSNLDTAEAYIRRAFEWRQEVYDTDMYPLDKHAQVIIELVRSQFRLASLLRELGREAEATVLEDDARDLLDLESGSAAAGPAAPAPAPGI